MYLKKCIYTGCETRCIFGIKNTKIPLYCAEHKPNNYVDVVSKLCEYKDCEIQATYGIKGKRAQYCLEHKSENHIDVKNKLCKECDTQASFGKPGTKTSEYCDIHKPDGYVNVKSKLCIINNCGIHARFGKLFEDRIHCDKHKQPRDIFVKFGIPIIMKVSVLNIKNKIFTFVGERVIFRNYNTTLGFGVVKN